MSPATASFVLLSCLATATARALPAPVPQDRHHLVHVDPLDARVADALHIAGVPVEAWTPDGLAEVVLTDAEREFFRRRQAPFTVVQDDLEGFYERRLAAGPPPPPRPGNGIVNPPFGQGGMGGYHTLAEMEAILDQFTAFAPAICTARFSLGQSIEGRDLWAVKISDNPNTDENEPEARFDAVHHAREPVSMETTLYFMEWLLLNYGSDPVATYLVDEREMFFVPVVNPDGYEYNFQTRPGGGGMWRKNRRLNGDGTYGVDPNRNYSYLWGYDNNGSSPNPGSETYRGTGPASEPEIQAMEAFFAARSFRTAISAHTYSDLWMYPYGYVCSAPPEQADFDLMGKYYVEENGYPYGPICPTLYAVNGDTVDHDWGVHGTYSGTVEIGSNSDGFWPPISRLQPLMDENLRGYQRIAMDAGSALEADGYALTESSGDGDAYAEPGEVFDLVLSLANAGTQGTGTSVVLGLQSSGPDVVVLTPPVDLGAVPAFTTFDNSAWPLQVQVAANAAPGTAVTLDFTASADGFTLADSLTLVVGEPLPVWLDDVETDYGWITGVPGDNAATGAWELADPVGTSSGGQPIQPENDHTPTGSICAVTDGRGGSAGTYDLDGGPTTLLTPEFDLEDAVAPQLRYWRWWADLGGAPNNDDLVVELTNDGGLTWYPVETVSQTQNAWTEHAFLVEDVAALTDTMQLRFIASDSPNDSVCEALVDDVSVDVFNTGAYLARYGTPDAGSAVQLTLRAGPGEFFLLYSAPKPGWYDLGPLGIWELDFATQLLTLRGTANAQGVWQVAGTLPPGTSGMPVHLQAFLLGAGGGGPRLSNAIDFVIR